MEGLSYFKDINEHNIVSWAMQVMDFVVIFAFSHMSDT